MLVKKLKVVYNSLWYLVITGCGLVVEESDGKPEMEPEEDSFPTTVVVIVLVGVLVLTALIVALVLYRKKKHSNR